VRFVRRKPARLRFFTYLLYLDDAGSADKKAEACLLLGGVSVFEAQTDFCCQGAWQTWREHFPRESASSRVSRVRNIRSPGASLEQHVQRGSALVEPLVRYDPKNFLLTKKAFWGHDAAIAVEKL
jgi:hypothetical protein